MDDKMFITLQYAQACTTQYCFTISVHLSNASMVLKGLYILLNLFTIWYGHHSIVFPHYIELRNCNSKAVCNSVNQSVNFCCRAGFWHPFCVSMPLCPVCPFECNMTIICQIMQHFNSSLVGLSLILPSIISCKSPSCLKTWPIHRCFLCQT